MASDLQARFAQMLADHAGIVGKIARAYTRTASERGDLEQDIATQLWRAFPRYDTRLAKLSTWTYRIALNVAISHLRRTRAPHDALGDDIPAPDDERDPRIGAMLAAVRDLPALPRALVVLYLEDRSYAEIAEILGISETNVAVKLHRIKQTLRLKLGA